VFLHYRQDGLFRPRPIFPIGNPERWKADSRLVRGQATDVSSPETAMTESRRDERYSCTEIVENRETTLKVAETHRTEKIVTRGVYSIIRHPQYLGGLLSHVGISFLLSAWYSLLSTPWMVVLIFLISKKEEEELIREFGKEYENYMEKVPMWTPRL